MKKNYNLVLYHKVDISYSLPLLSEDSSKSKGKSKLPSKLSEDPEFLKIIEEVMYSISSHGIIAFLIS